MQYALNSQQMKEADSRMIQQMGIPSLVLMERAALETVAAMKEEVEKEPLARIDYVEAVDDTDLRPAHTVVPGTLFAMAVYIGKTRLIDNFCTGGDAK